MADEYSMKLSEEKSSILGFRFGKLSIHTSRTIMFSELNTLLSHFPQDATKKQYTSAIIDENLLGKSTISNRKLTAERLSDLYSLDSEVCIFRVMLNLWHLDEKARPLLAFYCAIARDTLLRASVEGVLSLKIGDEINTAYMENYIESLFPRRFSSAMRRSLAQNINSSWSQAHYLKGRVTKRRVQPHVTPVNAVYALLLAYLEGTRSQRLFESIWAKLLDVPRDRIYELCLAASQRGLLDYKNAGGIIEVRFPDLLTEREEEVLHD